MKVHIWIKTYSTDTSYVEDVFTSRKKAEEALAYYIKMDTDNGHVMTQEFDNHHRDIVYTVQGSNDFMRYRIQTKEIK